MADSVVSGLIIFIASIVVAAAVSGVLINTVGGMSAALGDRGDDLSEDLRTDIEIISDPGATVYDSGTENVTLLVKNTGQRTLPPDPNTIDVLVDGQYAPAVSVSVMTGTDWAVGDVLSLEISTGPLDAGDHRVKVVVGGDSEVFTFRL